MFGRREAWIFRVHGRGRDAADAQRPGRALGRARERMRLVRQVAALAHRLRADQQPAILLAHAVARHLVGLVTRLALARAAMEAVLMPGTDDELSFERSSA